MPTINFYYQDKDQRSSINNIIVDIKEYMAAELSCGNITLKPDEVSVRLVKVEGDGMMGEIEAEVNAFIFSDRVKKQDEICLNLMRFIQNKTNIRDVKIWLILSELGHGWKE